MQKGKKLLSLFLCVMMAMVYLPSSAEEPDIMNTEDELVYQEEQPEVLAGDADLAQSVENGLISYLKMEENVSDEKGADKQPTLIGDATYEDGINGKAIRFAGAKSSKDRIELTGRDDLKFQNGDAFSVGFWYKAASTFGDCNIIGSKNWADARNNGWNIYMNTKLIGFSPISRTIQGDLRYTTTDPDYWAGKWVYVTVTRTSSGTNAMYVNGNKVSPEVRSTASSTPLADGTVCIGADFSTNNGPGNSLAIDEVKIWNRALAANEVSYLYTASAAIESMRIAGPETAAVGDGGVTVDLAAKVTKTQFGEVDPVEPVAWSVTTGNADITPNGASATVSLPGTLQDNDIVTVQAKIGGFSTTHDITVSKNVVPDRITITGDERITKPQAAIQKVYTAKVTDENGAEATIADPENINWTLTTKTNVQINGAATGKTVTVDVPADTLVGKMFTLKAEYKTFSGEIKVVIAPDRNIPQEIMDKVEYQLEFDGNLTPVKGAAPSLNGSMNYQSGVEGQSAVFTNGNYLDFGNYDLNNKSIAFSLKSNSFTGVQDPCIWGNRGWDNAYKNDKGLIFAYAYNKPSSFKTRIGFGGSSCLDNTFNYAPGYWSNYVINFDNTNHRFSVYKDGVLVKEQSTDGFTSGWQNGTTTLKLGNDGTGNYKYNKDSGSKYEFVVDKLMITDQVLSPSEILAVSEANKVLLTDEGTPEIKIDLVGGEKIPSGQFYNVSIFGKGQKMGLVAKTEFDVKYDPDAMKYAGRSQYAKSGITMTDDGNGTLHVVYTAAILNNEISAYSKSRLVQPIFETKNVSQKKQFTLAVENIKGYDDSGEEVEITATGNGYEMEVLPVNSLDLNQDGVVGAGDVALATTPQQKSDIAATAGIYPYKRALVITMDGGGKSFDPDKQYLCNESTNTYDVKTDLGDLRPKDGYAMQLMNNEFAMSYTAKATDPPVSAQNYCAITHGIPWKSLPSNYQFTNDIAGVTLWPDFGLETPKYPSIFWAIKNQQPDRKLLAITEWPEITNGILEQDVGTYFQYRSSSATNPLCFDQFEEYINDGRFKDTALTYMQSDTMDHYGHAKGYFTAGYYEELKKFDGFFKRTVDALKAEGLYDDTFFVVNSDHGGHRNANGSGSHGDASKTVDMDIMIGAHGQTVPEGKRLTGGNNKDIAAIALKALRMDKTSSMNNSEVFDSSMFLSQEDMASKERNVEKVSFDKVDNDATIKISNKQSKDIKALDTVIELSGRTVSSVDAVSGVSVLRQKTENGKLYLTLSGDSLNGNVATVHFGAGADNNFAMSEVMLGAADGSEIYSDLENLQNGSPSISGTGEIKGDADIVRTGADMSKTYEVSFKTLAGDEMIVQGSAVNWSVEGAAGVTLPNVTTGTSMTVNISSAVTAGSTFTLKAEYKGLTAQKVVTVRKKTGIPSDIKNAIETKLSFEGDTKATIGNDPTVSGSMNYSDGIRGKSGVFTNGNYLDFGKVDLKDKTIAFTIKSNHFTAVKDPVILANKDWNSGPATGFVLAYAWNKATDWKTRIADGTKQTDITFGYDPGEWSNVALVFDHTGQKYSMYLNGELVKTFDTTGYANNWESGGYSLKLGNDGTGNYAPNKESASDYEFEIDDFMIINKVLSAEDVKAVDAAQVETPDILMTLDGAQKIVAPQSASEETVMETYTVQFEDEDGNAVVVDDPENIRWMLDGAQNGVNLLANVGASAILAVAYGAEDQNVTLKAIYNGEDDTVCKQSMQIPIFKEEVTVESVRFVEEPASLEVKVPQPGGKPVELMFRAVAEGKFGVVMDDVVLDADNYLLLENPAPESAKVEIVEVEENEKMVPYAKVTITDKANVLSKLTLVAYVGDPNGQASARKEMTLSVERTPKEIVIVGAGSVDAKNNAVEEKYNAYLLDQYGQVIDTKLTWKIDSADVNGVGISADGMLIVQSGANSGNVKLRVSAEAYELSATKTVIVYGKSTTSGGGSGGGSRPGGSSGSGSSGGVVSGGGSQQGGNNGGGTPVKPADRFTDLPADHWAENAISSLIDKGIISGDGGSNTVRPEAEISREETVKILLGAIGASIIPAEDESVDAGTSQWAKEYMLTAQKIGIIKGDGAGNLNGNQSVTRMDAMVMVARALNVSDGDVSVLNNYTDGWAIPDYAKGAVAKLIELGVVKGYDDGTIGAENSITRAEMFTLVDRIAK